MKTCSRCGVSQPKIHFSVRVASPDGLLASCKICSSRDKKTQRQRLKNRTDEEVEAAAAARPPRPCRDCKVTKQSDEFPKDRGRRDGRSIICKPCSAARTRHYVSIADPEEFRARRKAEFANNRQRYRNYQVKKRFGITLDEYWVMHAAQGGLCAICKKPQVEVRSGRTIALAVDHDHATGTVRNLLCSPCNKGLGNFQDSPELLNLAVQYLHAHGRQVPDPPS